MPPEKEDVKQSEESSTTQATDVNTATTFDQAADALINGIVSESSTEADEKESSGDVLKKNTTEEEKNLDESQEENLDEKKDKNEKEQGEEEEKKVEEEKTSNEDDKKEEETKSEEDTSKHEESIPYSRFKEVNEKATRFEDAAKAHDSVVQFCQQNKIPPDQFSGGLQLMALINTNPKEALPKLEALVEELKVSTGSALPTDLQKEVTEGLISETRAKEIATLRVQSTQKEQQNRFTQLQQQQAQQQELLGGLAAWADSKRKLLPEFKPTSDPQKPGMFEDFLEKNMALWTTSPPKNVTEAIALADKALAATQSMIQRYQPKPKTRKAPPSIGQQRSSHTEPKTMDDVAKQIGQKHGYAM